MFKKKWFNVIESDEGFSVRILGRVGLKYKEGSRTMVINSEIMAAGRQPDILVDKSSIRTWNPPYDSEVIDYAKREAIVENIRQALEFYGWEIEVR